MTAIPRPTWKTVVGIVKHIGDYTHTVEDYERNLDPLSVGQTAKQIRGNKKVGDTVLGEIILSGFANSIQ